MEKKNQTNGAAPVKPQTEASKKFESLDHDGRIEHQLAQVIKLQWATVRALQSMDDSIAIVAGQKKRELDARQPDTAS